MRRHRLSSTLAAAFVVVAGLAGPALASDSVPGSDGPCGASLARLKSFSKDVPEVRAVLEAARVGMVPPPPWAVSSNPWGGKNSVDELVDSLADFAAKWCVALPTIRGTSDDGLAYISQMYWFFYRNPAGSAFGQGRDLSGNPLPGGFDFFKEFSKQVGAFMDSPGSIANIEQWVLNPRTEINDYIKTDPKAYTSWNDFFTREIKIDAATRTIPSRPIAKPEADYIISSPADCIVNPIIQILQIDGRATRRYIENPLQLSTVVDVKGMPIDIRRLLGHTPEDLAQKFEGGTGLSCILMPTNYHHYHAPVSGTVRHAEVVSGTTFGYPDFANFLPLNHNAAQPGADFSPFDIYERGVIIFEVKYLGADGKTTQTGHVAMVTVGLDTIGSVVLDPEVKVGAEVTRGFTRIGHFKYGGSMNLLLFSKGLATGAVQTRLGSQIGVINIE